MHATSEQEQEVRVVSERESWGVGEWGSWGVGGEVRGLYGYCDISRVLFMGLVG